MLPFFKRFGRTAKTTVPACRRRLDLEHLEDRLVPATFNVNSLADILSPPTGTVTLRSAIQAANAAPGNNTINLTIPGVYSLTTYGTAPQTNNAAGELAITGTGNLNIVNTSGGTVTVKGNGIDRVFDVNPAAETSTAFTVTFQGLTITGGNASPGDGAVGSGGGIRAQGAASIVLTGDVLTGNTATADGGGISLESINNDSTGTLTINASVISNNHAGDAGGGVESDGSGLVTINSGTLITGNTCVNQGAGVWLDAGTANLVITGTTISDNRALTMLGGGIGNAGSGSVTIADSSIEDNFSAGTGGGFADAANTGMLTVENSIFLDNSAVGNGGGIQEGGPQTTITGTTFEGNVSQGDGGGLFLNGMAFGITDCVLRNNVAVNGAGLEDQSPSATVAASTFQGNYTLALNTNSGGFGGGIDLEAGGATLNLDNSLFIGNLATSFGSGGAVNVNGAMTLNVVNSQFTGNVGPDEGGAINFIGTNLKVTGSTFDANVSAETSFSGGGALYDAASQSTLTNDTFGGNYATGSGGAIFDNATTETLLNVTINNNTAANQAGGDFGNGGALNVQNSIIALNNAATAPDVYGTVTDKGGNLIGTLSGSTGFAAGTLTGNPLLGRLEDNGGQFAGAGSDQQIVQTELILPTSTAFGTGTTSGAPTTDQRGFARIAGGRSSPSIGAYEPQYQATASANTIYVENLYEVLLNRPAAQDPGSAGWVNMLNAGASGVSVVAQIESSGEFHADEVETLFQRYLHRAPDATELQGFTGYLGTNTVEQFEEILTGSQEYFQLHGGTNLGFLNGLFEDALNRPLGVNELPSWLGTLGSQSRAQVVATVFASQEFATDEVTADYLTLLGRQPDVGSMGFIQELENNGATAPGIEAQILGSSEAISVRS